MTNLQINPWELGDNLNSTAIPATCKGKFTLVKMVHPKNKGVRNGIVGTFLMTSYEDDNGNKVELVTATESEAGYKVEFPNGKRSMIGTKFRGPQNDYRFINPKTGKWFQISKEKLTEEYATTLLATKVEDWEDKTEVEKDALVDEYLVDMFMFGLSQDLALPVEEDGSFEKPFVGLTTSLYRVSTPPAEGEKYPNVKITKWEKGKPSLDGEHGSVPEALALAIYNEYLKRDDQKATDAPF